MWLNPQQTWAFITEFSGVRCWDGTLFNTDWIRDLEAVRTLDSIWDVKGNSVAIN